MRRIFVRLGILLITFCSSFVLGFSQTEYYQNGSYVVGWDISGGDTIYIMKTIYVFPKIHPKTRSWREYYKLVYNFKKTYPYALLAKDKINEADSVLSSRHFSKREQEKYIKSFEIRLFKEFEKPLRNMSFSQGRLLMKLIDREVGQSSYYIIKDYRGSFTALFWQGIARIFGANLKKPYDKFGEDRITEELVQMYYNGSFDYLYYSLFSD